LRTGKRVLPDAVRVQVPERVAAGVEACCDNGRLDEHALRSGQTQYRLRCELAERLGADWLNLLRTVRTKLDRYPHAVVVTGQNNTASVPFFVGLAASLGRLTVSSHAAMPEVLQQIRVRDLASPDSEWHTDSVGWETPNEFTCLLCTVPGASGAPTELFPARDVLLALRRRPDLLRRACRESWPWLPDDERIGTMTAPVLARDGLRFLKPAMRRAAETYADRAHALIAMADELLGVLNEANEYRYSEHLTAGAVLAFDNRRNLHRRGVFDGRPDLRRTLLRVKLLDPSWARTCGGLWSGDDPVASAMEAMPAKTSISTPLDKP
jgi:alpha-ketoglutarate-dependent taurine dioxygenase